MKQQLKTGWQRNLVTLGPSIFLGLTLLASGTGKALIFGELPGELEFIDVLSDYIAVSSQSSSTFSPPVY